MPDQQLHQVQIFARVASLPFVNSAIGVANDQYGKLKSRNGIIKATLATTENAIFMIAETAKPVINKFDKPISIADNLACTGLDKLEQRVPVIKKNPEEIKGQLYNQGMDGFEGMKKLGVDKVNGLRDYSYSKVSELLNSTYFQALLKSVDTAIVLTENTVDHYLPSTHPETGLEEIKGEQSLVVRMGRLSEKMRKRIYENVMSRYVPLVVVMINNFKATVLVWLVPTGGTKSLDKNSANNKGPHGD